MTRYQLTNGQLGRVQEVLVNHQDGLKPEDVGLVSKTVYSLLWPETSAVTNLLWSRREDLETLYRDPHLKSQDGLHRPFLEEWRQWSGVELGVQFPESYPTNGASEAIAHLIARQASMNQQNQTVLHVFDGEYEGYSRYARAFNLETIVHARDLEILKHAAFRAHDTFWISNPSSIDGDFWEDFELFLVYMRDIHPTVKIYVDVTYIGAVKRMQTLDFTQYPNVEAVIFSLSKPFGVYYHRVGGVFARSPIDSLYGNRWFKNIFSISLGRALMRAFPVNLIANCYASTQERVVRELIEKGEFPPDAEPCNVILLARSPGNPAMSDMRDYFYRGDGWSRYCLTPNLNNTINGVSR